jgi:hypothetical protein
MIANVTMSFKYIGGSTLYSPINKLQNALSFNYFANSQVYDPRADYVASASYINDKKLIKDYNEKFTRTTFASNTEKMPEGTQETNYGLVLGLDSTKSSMGAFLAGEEVTTIADGKKDDVASSDAANSGPSSTDEVKNLKLTLVEYFTGSTGLDNYLNFTISKDANSTNQSDFKLTAKIINDNNASQTYTTELLYILDPKTSTFSTTTNNVLPTNTSSDSQWVFRFSGSQMTSVFTGFNGTDTYTFQVDGIGTPQTFKFTQKISTSTGPQTVNTPASNGNLKITEIDYLEVKDNFTDYPFAKQILVGVKNENIYKRENGGTTQVATDDQIKTFINKGLKVIIESIPVSQSPDKRYEQIVSLNPVYSTTPTTSPGVSEEFKCLENCDGITQSHNLVALCSSNFYMGDLVTPQFGIPRIKSLLDGNYMLSVVHGGQRVASKNFVIGNATAPNEFNDEFQIKQFSLESVKFGSGTGSLYFGIKFNAKGITTGGEANRLLKLAKDHTAEIQIISGSTTTTVGIFEITQYNTSVGFGTMFRTISKDAADECDGEEEYPETGKINGSETSIGWEFELDPCDKNSVIGKTIANAWNQPDTIFKLVFDTGPAPQIKYGT